MTRRDTPSKLETVPGRRHAAPGGCVVVRNAVLASLLLLAGCDAMSDVNQVYGKRGGPGSSSINGTVVLSDLFEAAGFETSAWTRLSPKLEKEDVILWFPDRYTGPFDDESTYLENWLAAQPNRTLVYVGRDYDATVDYWKRVVATVAPEQRIRARVRLAQAIASERADAEIINAILFRGDDNPWFAAETGDTFREVEDLTGVWTEELASDTTLRIRSFFEPNESDTLASYTLLGEADGAGMVYELSRPEWGSSKLILVANGSFLLNLPLANSSNRKLANQLVNACGPPSKACFLECGSSPMMITNSDRSPPFFLKLFTTFPMNLVMFQLFVLGMVYCLYIFPIFGRPKKLPEAQVSDFGKHVTALGEMIERTGDEAFANQKLDQYRNEVET